MVRTGAVLGEAVGYGEACCSAPNDDVVVLIPHLGLPLEESCGVRVAWEGEGMT